MSERKAIPPKSQAFEHGGQRYTCTFDPNAAKGEQWVWQVKYVRHYPYSGSAATMEAASKKARLLIHNMNKHVIAVEENSE
jgi:hypothetical protein